MKPIMFMKKIAENHLKKGKHHVNKKFAPLAEILSNQQYFDRLLRVTVNRGKSILEDGGEEMKEKK